MMPTVERIDYVAELRRIAGAAMDPRNPGEFVGAYDGQVIREAAAELERRIQSPPVERSK